MKFKGLNSGREQMLYKKDEKHKLFSDRVEDEQREPRTPVGGNIHETD